MKYALYNATYRELIGGKSIKGEMVHFQVPTLEEAITFDTHLEAVSYKENYNISKVLVVKTENFKTNII